MYARCVASHRCASRHRSAQDRIAGHQCWNWHEARAYCAFAAVVCPMKTNGKGSAGTDGANILGGNDLDCSRANWGIRNEGPARQDPGHPHQVAAIRKAPALWRDDMPAMCGSGLRKLQFRSSRRVCGAARVCSYFVEPAASPNRNAWILTSRRRLWDFDV